ncbi:hypothetical protein [Leptolyngbya sp. NK1-12]|uniref:hypothetical protein n=1 Tax=Leptolyngbya sp. NK1-12 TaxID=2547451 RepID=UPI00292E7229|nr:hypothetical protein [Leptolyngbya sp. NK1-12]
MKTETVSDGTLLGAGRSGQVYLVESNDIAIARKIFQSDGLTKLVHYVFFGVPNSYIWNEGAIRCAYYRRKLLAELVQFWFGDRLRVADAIATAWNESFKAYQLDTEYVQGRSIALCQPFTYRRRRELPVLTRQIMRPLQQRLMEAGFDGLVWQAGKGNPVALNNFLLTNVEPSQINDIYNYQFVWIDLESGVPALFPLNILTLFSFYIPKAIQYRHALFDDVDICRLKRYIANHRDAIIEQLGQQRYEAIAENIAHLAQHQRDWKTTKGIEQSIQYQLKKGKLTPQQADWYANHPMQWYGRELFRVAKKVGYKLTTLPVILLTKLLNKLKQIQYRQVLLNTWKALTSQRYRLTMVRNSIQERVKIWKDRKQLTDEEADFLSQRLQQERSSSYLVDLSVYLAIKVIILLFEISVLPLLFGMGVINEVAFGLFFVIDGPILRSIYTLYRMIQAVIAGFEIPWVAFLIGLIPFIGNVAYACQVIYSTAGKKAKVARFIVYDTFTRLGTKIPIWGGADTFTEHALNRCAYWLIRRLETLFGHNKRRSQPHNYRSFS